MAYLRNKTTLKLDFFSTKGGTLRHIERTSPLFSFKAVKKYTIYIGYGLCWRQG